MECKITGKIAIENIYLVIKTQIEETTEDHIKEFTLSAINALKKPNKENPPLK